MGQATKENVLAEKRKKKKEGGQKKKSREKKHKTNLRRRGAESLEEKAVQQDRELHLAVAPKSPPDLGGHLQSLSEAPPVE